MSPTVWREAGYVVRIYFDDHAPPHCHLKHGEFETSIALGDDATAPYVLDPGRMPTHRVREALRLVERQQERLLRVWRGENA